MEVTAAQLAVVLWAVIVGLLFRSRLYYYGFCIMVTFATGIQGVEYAPALWVPIDFVLGVAAALRGRSK